MSNYHIYFTGPYANSVYTGMLGKPPFQNKTTLGFLALFAYILQDMYKFADFFFIFFSYIEFGWRMTGGGGHGGPIEGGPVDLLKKVCFDEYLREFTSMLQVQGAVASQWGHVPPQGHKNQGHPEQTFQCGLRAAKT